MTEPYFAPPALLTPPTARAAYSDRTAWIMAKMSELAYEPFEKDGNEKLKEKLASGGFELVETFDESDPEKKIDTQAILVRKPNVVSVLAFRGTTLNRHDIVTDLRARFLKTEAGKAHQGFLEAFSIIEGKVTNAITQQIPADEPLYVTGHSLGGALATVAALRLDGKRTLAACYTFGSPRVGDREWAGTMKAPVYRVVNGSDGVPLVPGSSVLFSLPVLRFLRPVFNRIGYLGYRHVGDFRYLTTNDELSSGTGAGFDRIRTVTLAIVGSLVRFRFRRMLPLILDHRLGGYIDKLQKIAIERNS